VRYVERSTTNEPPSLAGPCDAVEAEMAAARRFYETFDPLEPKAKGYDFQKYKEIDVTHALRSMFHNKCAYCEDDLGDGLEVEHFRPKGGVTGEPTHKGYWWLAHHWTNLLPSCVPCNQGRRQHLVTEEMTEYDVLKLSAKRARKSHGKANQFPIGGTRAFCDADDLEAEQPMLIDPTREDPAPFFHWSRAKHVSVVLAAPLGPLEGERALSSIGVFALNRSNLVKSRTKILSVLRFDAEEIMDELAADCADGGLKQENLDRALRRVAGLRRRHAPDQPFSAMVKAFVDDLAQELSNRIAAQGP
jgi:hypothetical protein